ncbi:hypothetical protein XFF6166_850005 [Xanthomonas citri pv. fuscans]|nr:hypothetical protein XFF6166_850005 [Xanthomonas citri pv. fuscans]SOO04458.1 hypothetical protein XFF6960_990004 [Xanthomonas citri pv. fuscans]SOO46057.1 hypothetical protein XFF1815_950006 [Xanthomonas citri pv. fuscans]
MIFRAYFVKLRLSVGSSIHISLAIARN